MAQLVTDLIDPTDLINYVRQFDLEVLRPDAQLRLQEWLPENTIEDLEYRVRRGTLMDTDTAEFRAFDTPAPMTDRAGVSYIRGKLGPVSRQIPLGEEEFLRARSLMEDSDDPIIDAIYDDSERMIRAVQTRMELARGDVINDGKVTIVENGLVLEANFGRAAAMSKTSGTVWTNPAAPMLTDMLGWVQNYIDQNGVAPGTLMMSQQRLGNMALNAEMRAYAAANGTTPARINRATIDNIFATEGLPEIELYDTQVRVNKTRTRVLPANKVFLMPPAGERLGETLYGTTAEALLLRQRGLIDREVAPGIVAVITVSEHPVQTFTVGTAIAMPTMPNPDLVLDAIVAA